MKPAPFDYYAPSNVDEALTILNDLGYGVKVLAGGQSLVPAMNFRMAVPPALLDLNNIPELAYVHPVDAGGVIIGTMTRDSVVERDAYVKQNFPLIGEAMPHIAHPQIRNRGTFGGALAHADPTAQLPAVVWALNGRFHIRSKTDDRWLSAEEFFLGPFATAIAPEELLVEIELPGMPAHSGYSYQQTERQAGAQALVGVAVVVALDGKGLCKEARMVFLSVGEMPTLAVKAADKLVGKAPTEALIAEAAKTAAEEDITPGDDIHCSADFRRHLVEVLGGRALKAAFERAKQNGGK
jgi:aerobic carbon-monoxide dehydrogenase medium subunit